MYRIKWFIRKLFKNQKAEKPPAEVISVMDLMKPSGEWGDIYEPWQSYLNISSKAESKVATNQVEYLNEFGTVL